MKKGIEYRDVAKEIVLILSKYSATYKDMKYILDWISDEIIVSPIQDDTVCIGP